MDTIYQINYILGYLNPEYNSVATIKFSNKFGLRRPRKKARDKAR